MEFYFVSDQVYLGTERTCNSGPMGVNTMNRGNYMSEDESGFMAYFLLVSVVSILAYLVFHNKQKVPKFAHKA